MGQALFIIALGLGALDDGAGPLEACQRPRITTDAGIPRQWLDALRDACAGMQTNDAIDPMAVVRVFFAQPDLLLIVTTVDGREAVRRVSQPNAFRDTLEALIVLPTAVALDLSPASPEREPARPKEEATTVEVVVGERTSTEIGFGVDGRLATSGRVAFGPSAFINLQWRRWLTGVSLRWDALENDADNTVPQYEAQAVALGLTLGRRVYEDVITVDCAVEPRIVSTAQSHGEGEAEHRTSTTDVFVGGLARFVLGHGSLRPFLQADVEVAPTNLKRVADESSVYAPLPSWSIGLTAGMRWTVE